MREENDGQRSLILRWRRRRDRVISGMLIEPVSGRRYPFVGRKRLNDLMDRLTGEAAGQEEEGRG